jgi:hypothetical protein
VFLGCLLCFPVKHVIHCVEYLALFAICVVHLALGFANLIDYQTVLELNASSETVWYEP